MRKVSDVVVMAYWIVVGGRRTRDKMVIVDGKGKGTYVAASIVV